MNIHNALVCVLQCVANLIMPASMLDFCESIEGCHSHNTVTDRSYPHAFKSSFNMSVKKDLHDLDHFKLSCKQLIGKFLSLIM